MFFSLDLLEIFPLTIIYILFFSIFYEVMLFSFPLGKYLFGNYCEDSLIKYSILSIIIFTVIISILVNIAPIFAKYGIYIFYLSNLFIIASSKKIRVDFYKHTTQSKQMFFFTLILFLISNLIYKSFFVESETLVYFFDSHWTYFINPVSEILTSDYFSRLKMQSLYPFEWSAFHFFPASFNSIFLFPISQSGTLGILILKNFYQCLYIFFLLVFLRKVYSQKKNI